MKIFNADFNFADINALFPRAAESILSVRRLSNAAKIILSEQKRSEVVTGMPFAVMVEPSAICDMKCPICALPSSAPRKLSFLKFDVYKKFIEELGSTLIFLNLWNWGEPLLHPDIGDMVELATEKKIMTAIHTNGIGLRGEKALELIQGGLCYLVISFDGAFEQSYSIIRGKDNFNFVRQNVASFMKLKNSPRPRLPLVELKMIVTKDNENEMREFLDMGKNLGVERTTFRRLVWAHNPQIEKMAPTQIEFRQKHGLNADNKKRKLPCNRPWRSAVILANGDVVPCCSDTNFEYVMGNINEPGGFRQIWNNDRFRSFRSKLIKDPDLISICKLCPADNFRGDTFIRPGE